MQFKESELEQSPLSSAKVYKSQVKLKFHDIHVKTILGNHVMDKNLLIKSSPYI